RTLSTHRLKRLSMLIRFESRGIRFVGVRADEANGEVVMASFVKCVSSRRLKSHFCPTAGSLGRTACMGVSRALADRTFLLETEHERNFHRNSRRGSNRETFSRSKRLVVGVGVWPRVCDRRKCQLSAGCCAMSNGLRNWVIRSFSQVR